VRRFIKFRESAAQQALINERRAPILAEVARAQYETDELMRSL